MDLNLTRKTMLHIIQNDREVPPGTVTEHLDNAGHPYALHHPYLGHPLPGLQDIRALIVMGGAMGANDDARHPFLTGLKHSIRTVVEQGIPYLGICLGGQLLAAALGAGVHSRRWEELGIMEVELTEAGRRDRLFAGIDSRFATFQWHHDSFDIPAKGVLLASSPACPHQAFRIGPSAWGVQFHPEVTEAIIRDWCAWDPATRERSDQLVSEWQSLGAAYRTTARRMLENFLGVANNLCI